MKAYCINLDSRTDRWQECLDEFIRVGLRSVLRISARIDSGPLDDCAMDHASCVGLSINSGDDMCLIMEDDVQFVIDDWAQVEKAIIELSTNDPKWDLLFLGLNADPDELKKSGLPVRLTPNLYRVFSGFATHAYIVRSTVYQQIIQLLLQYRGTGVPHDVVYSGELLPKIRAYCVYPLMALQRPSFSSILNRFTDYSYLVSRWEAAISSALTGLSEMLPKSSDHGLMVPGSRRVPKLKYTFGMIVLNGDDFIEYALRSVYDFACEIIIVEGAVEEAAFMVGADGGSRDRTIALIESFPDPDCKITLIRGRWKDKTEQSNVYLTAACGDYVWQLDSDEVYKEHDLFVIDDILSAHKEQIDMVSFSPINFYHDVWTVGKGGRWEEKSDPFRRIFKREEGCYFSTHWPPTVVYKDLSKIRGYLSAEIMERDFGVFLYHYSYVTKKQVEEKVEYYNRKGYSPIVGSDLGQWYEQVWSKWTHPGCDVEKQYGSHLNSQKPSWTERFRGEHPSVMTAHPLFTEAWRSILQSPLRRFGTHYGGYVYPDGLPGLGRNSVIYCVGAGEDISHDIAVGHATGATIHIFDPTPRAIAHVSLAMNVLDGAPSDQCQSHRYGGGDPNYWNVVLATRIPCGQVQMHTWAVSHTNGSADFFFPVNPEWVSASLKPEGRSDVAIKVEVRTLLSTMMALGDERVDLLKLDIELVECEVLSDMLSEGIRPMYLSVDFDSARTGAEGAARCDSVIQDLARVGYRVLDREGWNVSFLLAR